MLDDKIVDKVVERLANRIEQANTYILKEIGRSIKEIGTINPTKANQLVQMLKYGGSVDKIINEIARLTNLNVKDIQDIFEEVAKSDYNFAKKFYKYRNKPFIPYEKNIALKNEVKALANITAQEYLNFAKTTSLGFGIQDEFGNVTFKGIKQTYYDLLDKAVLSIDQGKETFESAMQRQLKQIGESGLKVIYPTTYIDKDGIEKHYTRRLDSATRMNMEGALGRLHNEMQQQIGSEIDSDGVEISVHENPAEDHQLAQGRQFSNEEFDKLQTTGIARTYDGITIDMYIGEHFRPIYEWNCKHYVFAIILGIDKPQYSNEKLQAIIDRNNEGFDYEGKHYTMYEGTQLQRKIETAIRQQKDIQIGAKASGLDNLVQESQDNIRVLTNKYKELSNISGLPTEIERLKVEGYKKVNINDNEQFMLTKNIKIGKSNDFIKPINIKSLPNNQSQKINNIINNSNDIYKQKLIKYKNDIKIKNYKYNKTPVYNNTFNTIKFNIYEDSKTNYEQFFHEYSHMIDKKMGWPSQNKEFIGILNNDFQIFKENMKIKYKMNDIEFYNKMSIKMKTNRQYNSLSDIIGGITNNQCLGKGFHDINYWTKGKLEKEFFAHMGSAMARNNEFELYNFKKIFPNGYDYFVKVMKE